MLECAINTADGVKVADVVWCSEARFNQIENDISASIAPEICIEVKSDGNTIREIDVKKHFYFAEGAIEVWLCNQEGTIAFYCPERELKQSLLVPDFPNEIKR